MFLFFSPKFFTCYSLLDFICYRIDLQPIVIFIRTVSYVLLETVLYFCLNRSGKWWQKIGIWRQFWKWEGGKNTHHNGVLLRVKWKETTLRKWDWEGPWRTSYSKRCSFSTRFWLYARTFCILPTTPNGVQKFYFCKKNKPYTTVWECLGIAESNVIKYKVKMKFVSLVCLVGGKGGKEVKGKVFEEGETWDSLRLLGGTSG